MAKVSIIIPARNEEHLQKTIDSLLGAAAGDIEIIIFLDGYWPVPILRGDSRLVTIHSKRQGMRPGINACARIARGEFLMKCDAHCIFGKGFDKLLVDNCEENWLAVPSRYNLKDDTWNRGMKLTEHMYISPPPEFRGKRWGTYAKRHGADLPISDLMTFQGSCWFMPTTLFWNIGGLDLEYGTSGKEAQELGNKVWLSGGRVIRNKLTWYAHQHKRRNYSLPRGEREKSTRRAIDIWMNNKWDKQIHEFKWLVDKFAPVPGWENWQWDS